MLYGVLADPASAFSISLVAAMAYLLDAWWGEPRRGHPLVIYGRFASWLEACLNPDVNASNDSSQPHDKALHNSLIRGWFAWSLSVLLPLAALLALISALPGLLQFLVTLFIVYCCIAARSLQQHAEAVSVALIELENVTQGNQGQVNESSQKAAADALQNARQACRQMVSRDTAQLRPPALATATIESVVENANDAIIAPLFWFVLAGLPGIVLFRLSNTLDAMWGYRNHRFNLFGRFTARMDDLLAYVPARLTVLLFSLCDRRAWRVAWRDGSGWYSPNAGPVMAAGAGALGLQLGGAAEYHGERKQRPILGDGRVATAKDIHAAVRLVKQASLILLVVIVIGACL